MKLKSILPDTSAADFGDDLPPILPGVIEHTVRNYGSFNPPWHGYLAFVNDDCIGTCAFKSPPVENTVEIAYFTFPEHEGLGHATSMTKELIRIAREADERILIIAQTLPEENASTAVLKKTGFLFEKELEHIEDGQVWQWRLSSPDGGGQ